jgi:hypothetical protein
MDCTSCSFRATLQPVFAVCARGRPSAVEALPSPPRLYPRPMPRRRPTLARAAALVVALLAAWLAAPPSLAAQRYVRPEREWVTLRTEHFRLHAPRELVPWTRRIAERMEAVREAERRVIGFVPPAVTDVVVEDPLGDANGAAFPFLDGPAVFLWPVPPTPRSFIGNSREWGEILAVHEFAHVAHLTRPSRNSWQRLWRSALPGRIGPVATRTPRWAIEGYATYVEGALTGSGRPHGALRAAVLRQWALEGRLPTYGGMSAAGDAYLSGSFAYLMGSAYLEWLGAERGDSALTALWRRLSARQNRTFDAAFAGVWGESPAALYGRFTARVTAAAFAERARLEAAGLVEGAPYQRLTRGTGDPAVSRDGRRLAVTLAGGDGQPSRVVLWRAGRPRLPTPPPTPPTPAPPAVSAASIPRTCPPCGCCPRQRRRWPRCAPSAGAGITTHASCRTGACSSGATSPPPPACSAPTCSSGTPAAAR